MAIDSALTRSAFRQIEKSRTKVGGNKVVTDDIQKLKGLAMAPDIPKSDLINYYAETVTIEYYIPKESRFAYEKKILHIGLIDPTPKNIIQKEVFNWFVSQGLPIDVIEVMNQFSIYIPKILQYYSHYIHLHESTSIMYQAGLKDDPMAIRKALYMNEVLRKFEPTVPALEIMGDFTTYNINWCIRFLNRNKIPCSLEDRTVEYFIHRYRTHLLEKGSMADERFEILADIFLTQAFPDFGDDFEDLEGFE